MTSGVLGTSEKYCGTFTSTAFLIRSKSLLELLAALRRELRTGPHVIEELVQIAFETDLLTHLLELAGDACNFAQTELVDLFRRHVSRGRRLDLVAIESVAALHVHESDAVAGVAQIFVLQKPRSLVSAG